MKNKKIKYNADSSIVSTFIIQAQDWPQFLGPNRTDLR